MLVAALAPVNAVSRGGYTPLFEIRTASESTIDVVSTLLRAGASLDPSSTQVSTLSFEEFMRFQGGPFTDHLVALCASVRAAGSWKAHCRLAHKQVLRLRSLVARGRAKLPRTRRARGRDARQERSLEFVVRQGDNGIVWNILSFWRETA